MAELIAGQRAAAAADLETAISVAQADVEAQKRQVRYARQWQTREEWLLEINEMGPLRAGLNDLLAQRDRERADAVARDAEGII